MMAKAASRTTRLICYRERQRYVAICPAFAFMVERPTQAAALRELTGLVQDYCERAAQDGQLWQQMQRPIGLGEAIAMGKQLLWAMCAPAGDWSMDELAVGVIA